jgi:uncharacterized short protein YbdD (DUF466 family)
MLGDLLRAIRRICGMPDYGFYVKHLQQRHPEVAVPTEREFYEDFIRTRYEAGPTRCC